MSVQKSITVEEVSKHNKPNDCWTIIDNNVYDITKFLELHPGGKNVMINYLGKDATQVFNYFHAPIVKSKYKNLIVGVLSTPKPVAIAPILSYKNSFGEGIPMGDPNYV